MDFTTEIRGHTLEYIDEGHIYLVDGVIVPSITQILKVKFGNKYDHVDRATLQRASEAGTRVHEAIELYCKRDIEIDGVPELRGFKFLERQYRFEVMENELPVILFDGDEPISAGRMDMVVRMDDQIGLADIKRTSTLDKEYLFYQLNLYGIAYRQCHGVPVDFLRGIHLREDVRKFVPIPINEGMAWELVKEYRNE